MRRRAFFFLFLALAVLLALSGQTCAQVDINWGAFCPDDDPLMDELDNNLEGQLADTARCAHGPYDLVYLVWDRDADGVELYQTCLRVLSGDTVVDSSFIGTGILCPSCSTGGFSENFSWTVTDDYDTFYVITLNDSVFGLATYYGNSGLHFPDVWEVHKDSIYYTLACTEAYGWGTYYPFDEVAVFNDTSIVSGGLLPGDKKVGMVRITANVFSGNIPFTSMRVDNGPSAGCTNDYLDIDSVKIYREVTGAGFDPDDDSLIGEEEWGPGPPAGGTATVTFFVPETLTAAPKYYYIAFDISLSATMENCVAACVWDSTYMGVPELCMDGNFPFCSDDVGLPVEISRFDALPGDRKVTLHWTTESEIDNKGFNIYRSLSADGIFSKVNEELIPGAGNSYMRLDYDYTDKGLTNGLEYFYKLESVSYGNALSTYHQIVSAIPSRARRVADRPTGLIGLGPNPFARSTALSIGVAEGDASALRVAVYDVAGRLVRVLADGKLSPGTHRLDWDGTNEMGARVSAGLYFMRFKSSDRESVLKVVRLD